MHEHTIGGDLCTRMLKYICIYWVFIYSKVCFIGRPAVHFYLLLLSLNALNNVSYFFLTFTVQSEIRFWGFSPQICHDSLSLFCLYMVTSFADAEVMKLKIIVLNFCQKISVFFQTAVKNFSTWCCGFTAAWWPFTFFEELHRFVLMLTESRNLLFRLLICWFLQVLPGIFCWGKQWAVEEK